MLWIQMSKRFFTEQATTKVNEMHKMHKMQLFNAKNLQFEILMVLYTWNEGLIGKEE